MRAVDTNVLVRLITRDDAEQLRKAEAFIERGAWASHLALVEAMWVLTAVYGLTPRAIGNAVAMLLAHRTIALQDPDTVESALNLFRDKPSLGFADCLMLEIARKAGHLPLGTFDRGMAKLSGVQHL